MQPIDKLDEGKATLRILLYLHRKGQIKLTAIIQDMPIGQKAVYTALNTLRELTLLTEETSREFPFTRKFKLTPKGEKIAQQIAQIENLLGT
ncbi:MAG TPA: winged helix-turn-helix transcriptional regulator [Candidatus Krumholzibacteriaceae bacterium]|jgi:DNA-binding HxlR family transcriptional regulator|nr:winged helix-turn-helix transcriptional regulator [Candidatus Krumholzibacteriaceae bacterium]